MAAVTSSGFARRPMRWWHLEEVVAIEDSVFGATAWTLETFLAELAAADRWLRVAEAPSGEILGYIDVAMGGREADLMTIAVRPDDRGRGIGAALLQAGIAAAASGGAHRMLLEVASENPARELYQRYGFVELHVRAGYYPDGSDAVVMRRRISEDEAASALSDGAWDG